MPQIKVYAPHFDKLFFEHAPQDKNLHPVPKSLLMEFVSRGASPELAEKMVYFTSHLYAIGVPVLVYCIHRTNEEQAALYAQGRTKPGNIITNAKPGTSKHNRYNGEAPASDAFDACPLINGKPSWLLSGDTLTAWHAMGNAANMSGLVWGRHFKSMGQDWPHFEHNRTN